MKKFRFIALALILLIMIPLAASCSAKANAADRDIYYDNSLSSPDYAPESAGKGEDGKFDGFTSDSSAGAIAPPSSVSNPEYERKIIKFSLFGASFAFAARRLKECLLFS